MITVDIPSAIVVCAVWHNDGTAGLAIECHAPECEWWHELDMKYGDVSAEASLSVLVAEANAHQVEAQHGQTR